MHQKERKQVQGRCRIADAGTDLVSSCPLQHVLFCAVLYYLHHLTSFFSLSTLLCPMPRPSPSSFFFSKAPPVLFPHALLCLLAGAAAACCGRGPGGQDDACY